MAQHEDFRYIVALREHNSRVIEELYQKCSPRIIAWVTANNGSAADAGDLFQDALVSVYRSAEKKDFQLTCPIGALIFTICRNRWINQLRRKIKETEVRKEEAKRYNVDPHAEATYVRLETDRIEREKRDAAFARLSETCQQLLRLLARGVPSAEAAERMGMNSANTLYRRKNACSTRWRELYEEDLKPTTNERT